MKNHFSPILPSPAPQGGGACGAIGHWCRSGIRRLGALMGLRRHLFFMIVVYVKKRGFRRADLNRDPSLPGNSALRKSGAECGIGHFLALGAEFTKSVPKWRKTSLPRNLSLFWQAPWPWNLAAARRSGQGLGTNVVQLSIASTCTPPTCTGGMNIPLGLKYRKINIPVGQKVTFSGVERARSAQFPSSESDAPHRD
jgi:hypothetical protein